ncbi:MAG TPA: hypothetical protein VFB36_12905 [Nevskiaceae bacterium]|nr:hypothetical protein [Nevskiaceae bacterium]
MQFTNGAVLIWGSVLALTLACAIGLLVLIIKDRRADARTTVAEVKKSPAQRASIFPVLASSSTIGRIDSKPFALKP